MQFAVSFMLQTSAVFAFDTHSANHSCTESSTWRGSTIGGRVIVACQATVFRSKEVPFQVDFPRRSVQALCEMGP